MKGEVFNDNLLIASEVFAATFLSFQFVFQPMQDFEDVLKAQKHNQCACQDMVFKTNFYQKVQLKQTEEFD